MVKGSRQKFLSDLKAGQAGEEKVAKILKKVYGADSITQVSNGKAHDFKLHFGDKEETFEVKTDFMAAQTNNVFLEFCCNGKPSGLLATTSFRWAILLPHLNEVIVFCPKEIWSYLSKSKHKRVNGGDGGRASGYLIDIDTLESLPFTTSISSK